MAIAKWLRHDPHQEVSDLDHKRDMTSLLLTFMLGSITALVTNNLDSVIVVGIVVYTFLRYAQRG